MNYRETLTQEYQAAVIDKDKRLAHILYAEMREITMQELWQARKRWESIYVGGR
jgi:hypothetical protein